MQDKTYTMSIRPFHLPALAALLLFCSSCIKNLPATNTQGKTPARALTAASSSPATYTFNLPARVATPFIWGVNGHPLAQIQYVGNLPLQMRLLNELQAPWYRVDFNPDQNGGYTHTGMTDLFAAASAGSINILPVIIWDSAYVFSLTPAQALTSGQATGQAFVQNYGAHFAHYYQMGNEEDLVLSRGGNNSNQEAIACAYFTGLNEGIKAADPLAKTIINSAENTGFFAFLDNNRVLYDIIGYDFYRGESELAADFLWLTRFYTKDIWLTELNNYVTASGTLDDSQAHAIDDELEALDQKTQVKAVFFYELFNEDGAPPSSGTDAATLGLTSWYHEYDSVNRKPVFEEYKFKIEETDFGWYDFAYATYLYCDFRQPDPSGLQFWTNWLTTNRNIPGAINIILPQENYARWVDQQFQLLLGRAADPSGESYWTQQLVNGSTRESVIESFVGGAEFWQLAGSNNAGLVNRAYQLLLNRLPDGSDPDWVDELNNGQVLPWQVAQGILGTTEYQTNYVTYLFNTVLNHAPDPGGRSFWVGQMQSGMNQLDVFKSFLNGPEFYQQAIHQGYNRNHPGYTF